MPPKKKVAAAAAEAEAETPATPSSAAKKRARKDVAAEEQVEDAAGSPAAAPPARRSSSSGPVVTEESVYEGTVPFQRVTKDADFDATKHWKIMTWNVAGLRALLKKEGDPLKRIFSEHKPDVMCLQETKLSPDDRPEVWASLGIIPGYSFVDNVSFAKKGYSGTRTYIKEGSGARFDLFDFDLANPTNRDAEGRVVTTVWNHLAIVNSYVPNSGLELDRLEYRVKTFDPLMRKFLADISAASKKTTGPFAGVGGSIWTGDLNVAERDYDRFWGGNFKQMQKSPGFTPEERVSFRQTLTELDMTDAFRHLYPNAAKVFSFWSARFDQRAKNNGWRLDYFVVSRALVGRVVECFMMPQYTASDHCPIALWLRK